MWAKLHCIMKFVCSLRLPSGKVKHILCIRDVNCLLKEYEISEISRCPFVGKQIKETHQSDYLQNTPRPINCYFLNLVRAYSGTTTEILKKMRSGILGLGTLNLDICKNTIHTMNIHMEKRISLYTYCYNFCNPHEMNNHQNKSENSERLCLASLPIVGIIFESPLIPMLNRWAYVLVLKMNLFHCLKKQVHIYYVSIVCCTTMQKGMGIHFMGVHQKHILKFVPCLVMIHQVYLWYVM